MSRSQAKYTQKRRMPDESENYGFNIPEENEFYDMELENENWRKLDAVLKEISDKLDAVKTTE